MPKLHSNSLEAQLTPGEKAKWRELLLYSPHLSLEEIREQGPPIKARSRSYRSGSKPTIQALSRLAEKWRLEEASARNVDTVANIKRLAKKEMPDIDPEELDMYADRLFKVKAVREQSQKEYLQIRKLELDQERVRHDARKVALAEFKAKLLKQVGSDDGPIPREQVRQLIEQFDAELTGK